MKHISKWASRNILFARALLVTGHFILIVLAYFLVKNLQILHYELPKNGFHISLLFAFLIFLIYPSGRVQNTFLIRKVYDFLLLVITFITITYCFSFNNSTDFQDKVSASTIVKDSLHFKYDKTAAILESLSYRDKKSLTEAEKKVLKKEIKYQARKIVKEKKHHENNNDDSAIKIILIILLALGLILLLSMLACGIACAGLEILAVITAIVGLAGIFFLAAVLIRNVNRKKRAKTFTNPETT